MWVGWAWPHKKFFRVSSEMLEPLKTSKIKHCSVSLQSVKSWENSTESWSIFDTKRLLLSILVLVRIDTDRLWSVLEISTIHDCCIIRSCCKLHFEYGTLGEYSFLLRRITTYILQKYIWHLTILSVACFSTPQPRELWFLFL